jgi:predicted P-loop ATPase
MNNIFNEAKRLHSMGFAILWLHNKGKRPVKNAWTSGDREAWPQLNTAYNEGCNVGVRTGSPSKIGNAYLACIDVDIKNPDDADVALKVKNLIDQLLAPAKGKAPQVKSGSGNGSKHFYFVSPAPFKMITVEKTSDFEICIYSDGRQMVLSPSVHPNGKLYEWVTPIKSASDLPLLTNEHLESFRTVKEKSQNEKNAGASTGGGAIQDFEVSEVDLDSLQIHTTIKNMIVFGEKVADRSGALLPICAALVKAQLSVNQILTILTDTNYYIGEVGFDHAKTTSRTRAAAWVYKYSLKKILDEQSAEKLFEAPVEDARELSFDELGEQENIFNELKHWSDDLDRTQHGLAKGTLKNVVLILTNEFEPGMIKRDLFAARDFYTIATPWGGQPGGIITDDDIAQMKLWFGKSWGFEPNDAILGSAVTCLALENGFDPLIEHLESLPEWDGVSRLDTWLADYFEAEGDADYLAQVFRKWILGFVLRAYEPGAKFDWMPIFEGPQGVGKSSFGRLLVGEKYFLDWLPDLANKDAALSLQGIWAVEIGELASFRKAEMEVTKAFVTRTVDKIRPPYGRRQIESPRRCLFFGTTNHETYLRDETGNRRFKPVRVGNLNFKQLRKDRDQLFAEAIAIYKYGFENLAYLDITGDAKKYEKQIQSEKMTEDDSNAMQELLADFFNDEKKKPNGFNFEKFTLQELFHRKNPMLGPAPLEKFRFEMRNMKHAAKAIKALGGQKSRSSKQKFWVLKWDVNE